MKIYRVGGAVRDELLGRPVADRDFVVVGSTPEEMVAGGLSACRPRLPGIHPSGFGRRIRAGAYRAQKRARLSRFHVPRRARSDPRGGFGPPRPDHQCHGARLRWNADRSLWRRARSARRRPAPRRAGLFGRSAARAACRAFCGPARLRRRPGNRGPDARDRGQRGNRDADARARVAGAIARLDGAAPRAFLCGLAALRSARAAAAGSRRAVRRAAAGRASPRNRHRRPRAAGARLQRRLPATPLPSRYAVLTHDLGKGTTARTDWPRHHRARAERRSSGGSDERAPACAGGVPRSGRPHGSLSRRRSPRRGAASRDAARSAAGGRRPAPPRASGVAVAGLRGRCAVSTRQIRRTLRPRGLDKRRACGSEERRCGGDRARRLPIRRGCLHASARRGSKPCTRGRRRPPHCRRRRSASTAIPSNARESPSRRSARYRTPIPRACRQERSHTR